MADFDVDSALVPKLAALLEEAGLGEIEYEADGQRIRVARPAVQAVAPYLDASANPSAAPLAADSEQSDGSQAAVEAAEHPGTITSPMVGTAYLAPTPDEGNFVSPGDTVEAGQTLLLIEAMKTFNEVKAERAGRVVSILIESNQPVEFGEPLMIIE